MQLQCEPGFYSMHLLFEISGHSLIN